MHEADIVLKQTEKHTICECYKVSRHIEKTMITVHVSLYCSNLQSKTRKFPSQLFYEVPWMFFSFLYMFIVS